MVGGLRERVSESTSLIPHTGMAALYIVLMAATHCAHFSQEVVYQSYCPLFFISRVEVTQQYTFCY